jgi:hypothetical protein
MKEASLANGGLSGVKRAVQSQYWEDMGFALCLFERIIIEI